MDVKIELKAKGENVPDWGLGKGVIAFVVLEFPFDTVPDGNGYYRAIRKAELELIEKHIEFEVTKDVE